MLSGAGLQRMEGWSGGGLGRQRTPDTLLKLARDKVLEIKVLL